ncbi:MAG: hypothetical protein U0X93_17905 [Anaerolineales bacterium]
MASRARGKLKVIIGARSALFAPLPNIGLIVADECHDSSFHQTEPPFYHAVTGANLRASMRRGLRDGLRHADHRATIPFELLSF